MTHVTLIHLILDILFLYVIYEDECLLDYLPLILCMAFFTTLSQPSQHILTLSSTVCKKEIVQIHHGNGLLGVVLINGYMGYFYFLF